MATLVLSTVGTAIAGPVGGLLGSLVGQSIDQQLIGGGPRKGPRLGDLSVQTSSYGTQIPRIYGTMRVAGTVVWATDIKEESELQGDGKSQPETVAYTYSASFAVALSSRRASRVRRVWADGKLVRGAAGDWKVRTKFRFHPGSESQSVDSLIASEEGLGLAPAYRGTALAVFEDLQLAEFGNRIPALTFELVADEGDGVGIAELLQDASAGVIECDDQRMVGGYAAHGESVAAAIGPLVEAFAVELHDRAGALRSPDTEAAVITPTEAGASAEGIPMPTLERELSASGSVPAALSLSYYDRSRDYQTGQARVSTPGPSRLQRVLAMPCVLDAGAAKSIGESLLLRAWALRERIIVRLPARYLDVRPGTRIQLPGLDGEWATEHVEVDRFVVVLTLRPAWAHAGERSADGGRPLPQTDVVAAPSRLALFDLSDPGTEQPVLVLAAASPSGAWKPVPVEIEAGGVQSAGRTAIGESILGTALTILAPGQAALMDMANSFDVHLANADHWLQSRDDAALAMGANLAVIGDELIQFGQADVLSAGKFRLSRLLRGCRGSEWAMGGHLAGENFALLDARTMKAIALPVEMLGTTITVTAHGPGDVENPPSITRVADGEAMRPLAPVHLSAAFETDGSLYLSWVRRSRLAWHWLDEVDSPPDPSVQGYRVRIAGASATIERDCGEEQATFSAPDVTSLGSGPIEVQVRQVGTLALSRPESILINL